MSRRLIQETHRRKRNHQGRYRAQGSTTPNSCYRLGYRLDPSGWRYILPVHLCHIKRENEKLVEPSLWT